MTDDLWLRVDAALIQARSRKQTLFELNRLLRKRFSDLPERYLTQDDCEIRTEWLTATQLALFHPGHTRAHPHQMIGPVIACEYQDKTYLLDGTNRLNVWLRNKDTEKHETIILKKRSESNG